MKKILLTVGITVLKILANILYCFLKMLPNQKKLVMITRQSNDLTLDFLLLKEELEKRNTGIKIVVLAKKLEKGVVNKIIYIFYTIKIMYHLSTSKVCVLDGYCIPVSILKHKKSLKIVQLWHASGAVKKFAYQILDKKEGSSSKIAKLMNMHKNYHYLIAPSKVTAYIFKEAFHVPEEKIVKLGLPRLEYICNPKYDKTEEFFHQYPNLKGKENILYIPTFRKNEKVNLEEILNYNLDTEKYNLMISLHPLDKTYVPKQYQVDSNYNTFDLIKIADYIITDYSVLSIEASILNKPIFLYLYDYHEYQKNRGLNIQLDKELKSFTSQKFSDIMTKIKEKDYNMQEIKQYKEKYIEVDTYNTIKNLGDFLLKIYKGEK